MIAHTAQNDTPNATNDARLIVLIDQHCSRCRQARYQKLSKSAGRAELNRKNVNQALGATTANGAFTSNQLPAVTHPIVIARSGARSRRRCTINGRASSTG